MPPVLPGRGEETTTSQDSEIKRRIVSGESSPQFSRRNHILHLLALDQALFRPLRLVLGALMTERSPSDNKMSSRSSIAMSLIRRDATIVLPSECSRFWHVLSHPGRSFFITSRGISLGEVFRPASLGRIRASNQLKMANQRLHLSSASQKVGCPRLPASSRSSTNLRASVQYTAGLYWSERHLV